MLSDKAGQSKDMRKMGVKTKKLFDSGRDKKAAPLGSGFDDPIWFRPFALFLLL